MTLQSVQRRLLVSSRELIPDERCDRLVHALAQLPDSISATIWADGPDRDAVRRLARAYGLGSRLAFADVEPAAGDWQLVFPSTLNRERARIREVPGGRPPVLYDPDGGFSPQEGRVRTLGEMVETLYEPDDPPATVRTEDDVLARQRIVVVSSIATHYRIPLFNGVNARLRNVGAAFRAVFWRMVAPIGTAGSKLGTRRSTSRSRGRQCRSSEKLAARYRSI